MNSKFYYLIRIVNRQSTRSRCQASTDVLSSICLPVHLRPHFYLFNSPSSESFLEMDGLSSSTVHLRPSMENNHCFRSWDKKSGNDNYWSHRHECELKITFLQCYPTLYLSRPTFKWCRYVWILTLGNLLWKTGPTSLVNNESNNDLMKIRQWCRWLRLQWCWRLYDDNSFKLLGTLSVSKSLTRMSNL